MTTSVSIALVVTGLFGGAELGAPFVGSPGVARSSDRFEDLEREYRTAYETWRSQIRAAEDSSARRAVRKREPGPAYWPRFEALEVAGSLPALLWMVDNVNFSGKRRSEQDALVAELYGRMIDRYSNDAGYLTGLEELFGDRRLRSADDGSALDALADRATESAPNERTAAFVAWYRAMNDAGSKDTSRSTAALETLERLEANEHLPEEQRELSRKRIFRARHLVVGAEAPLFEGQTPSGDPIALADYRGQVVLLDFFGFW